jgi:hypothetical protein
MPEYIQYGLFGTIENFATTLRAIFESDWDNTKTNSITPVFLSDEDMTSALNVTPAGEGMLFEEGNTRVKSGELDDTQDQMETDVYITIFAPNKFYRTLFQNEADRILRKNRPTQGTKIKKSDGEDSAILGWSWPLPEWRGFDLGLNKPEATSKVQIILKIFWQRNWSQPPTYVISDEEEFVVT